MIMKHSLVMLALLAGLTGCATTSAPSGVEMTADEAKACAAETCTVWTPGEIRELIEMIFTRGFNAGAAAARGSKGSI
jgi:outer membrane lipoprotein SlyB